MTPSAIWPASEPGRSLKLQKIGLSPPPCANPDKIDDERAKDGKPDELIDQRVEMIDFADRPASAMKPAVTMKPMPSQKVTPATTVRLATLPAESPAGP